MEKKCFCCNKLVKGEDIECPYCGALLKGLEVEDTRNPNTSRFVMSDGSQIESNKFILFGSRMTVLSLIIMIYVAFDNLADCLIMLPVLGIGIVLWVIGYIKIHQGKIIVRQENDIIRQDNPDYRTKEDDEDILDKIRRKVGAINIQIGKKDSVEEKLRELKGYYEEELISKEEYERAKASILKINC